MPIKRKLSLFDTIMIVVSLVIGIGIFRTPSIVARDTGSPELFFTAWITGGVICLIGGLVFAEIGARNPVAGGFYKIVSDAYHPAIAFMLNWLLIIITSGATFAAVALIASEYLIKSAGDIQPFFSGEFLKSDNGIKTVAALITLFLFAVNYLGIKAGAITLNIITVLKILIILFFSFISVFYSGNTGSDISSLHNVTRDSGLLVMVSGFFIGLRAVFFTVGGYQSTVNLSADVINPRKNLPLGIITGVIIIVSLYLLINYGYYKLLGFEGIAKSDLIAADMANKLFGPLGSRIISLSIFISAAGFMNATILQTPRTYHAMAEDKVLPKIFKKVNPKNQVQEYSLLFMFLLVTFFILTQGKFEKILNLIMFNDSLSIAVAASTLFVYRYRSKKENKLWDGFKVPLYPVMPAIFVLFLLLVSFTSFKEDILTGSISLALLLLFYPLYLLMTKFIK
ncbi:MAG: amino acid permease [Ignavibacteriae bacterium]|nr:amino acid permease [Ignavibacteriota bacterium]